MKADWQETLQLRSLPKPCTLTDMKVDEDKARWDERLTKVAKHKPVEKPG